MMWCRSKTLNSYKPTKKMLGNVIEDLDTCISEVYRACDFFSSQFQHLKKTIDFLKEKNEKDDRLLNQNSETIAQLYHELDDKEFRLSQFLQQANEADGESSVEVSKNTMCECCCEVIDDDNYAKCSRNHYICNECLSYSCKIQIKSLNIPKNHIDCCSMHECDGVIDVCYLSKVKDGREFLQEIAFHQSKDMFLKCLEKYSVDELKKNLTFMRSDGTFRALMCPSCNYGPVLHADCDDLLTHHNQLYTNSTTLRINNACPQCNHLTEYASEYKIWNGL